MGKETKLQGVLTLHALSSEDHKKQAEDGPIVYLWSSLTWRETQIYADYTAKLLKWKDSAFLWCSPPHFVPPLPSQTVELCQFVLALSVKPTPHWIPCAFERSQKYRRPRERGQHAAEGVTTLKQQTHYITEGLRQELCT